MFTERPGIRLDSITSGTADVSQVRLRRLAAQTRLAAYALSSNPTHSTVSQRKQHLAEAVAPDGADPGHRMGTSLHQRVGRFLSLAGKDEKASPAVLQAPCVVLLLRAWGVAVVQESERNVAVGPLQTTIRTGPPKAEASARGQQLSLPGVQACTLSCLPRFVAEP